VCKSKHEGGLGVRYLRQVNLALLAKWRWRYLLGDGGLWRDILIACYGVCYPSPHLGGRPSGLRGVSWWSNISLLGGDREATGDWFSDGVVRVIGDGLSTHFWHDPWCGPSILRVRFRRLFNLSLQVERKVGEIGHWEGESGFGILSGGDRCLSGNLTCFLIFLLSPLGT